jgi:endonuclease/exonuclease/phosphatase family metal-dependent hydrolase
VLLHWNLAGWARHQGRPEVARLFADAVLDVARPALAVTVNEVCDRQYDAMAEALAPAGFSAAAAWSIPDFDRPGCASYGNAVFWRRGDGGVERITYPDELQQDGASTRERRTLLIASAAGFPLRIATTHPAPYRGLAARQVAHAVGLLEAQPDRPCVLAGDLNLPPWDRALDPLYATHQEADRWGRRWSRPTHQGFRKLDYVFVPRGSMRVVPPLRISFRPRWSDHARLAVRIGPESV